MQTLCKIIALMTVAAAAVIVTVYAIGRFVKRREDRRQIAFLEKEDSGISGDIFEIADYRDSEVEEDEPVMPSEKDGKGRMLF